jgi:hypothetical protein
MMIFLFILESRTFYDVGLPYPAVLLLLFSSSHIFGHDRHRFLLVFTQRAHFLAMLFVLWPVGRLTLATAVANDLAIGTRLQICRLASNSGHCGTRQLMVSNLHV